MRWCATCSLTTAALDKVMHFLTIFLLILSLFKCVYSCCYAVGQRYGLTLQEFGHLLHFMRIYNFNSCDDVIGKFKARAGINGYNLTNH
jgi:hypothetical protein